MVLWALAIGCGVLVGIARGGSFSNFSVACVRGWPWLVVALGASASLAVVPLWARGALAAAACAALVAWCVANARRRAMAWGHWVCSLGLAANALVMAANAGMPVSRASLAAAGFSPGMDVARDDLYKHTAMTVHTHLAFLGDAVPVRLLHTVVSAGDIVMLVGLALMAFDALQEPKLGTPARGQLANLAS